MRFIMFGLILMLGSGCATPKQWSAIGGSRSDGTIRIAYSYGLFETPELEKGQGPRVAKEKCRIWGYTGAELFGNAMQQCIATNQHGCVRWRVYADFQCTTNAAVAPIAPVVAPVGPMITNN